MFFKFQRFSSFLFIGMLACLLHTSTAHAAWEQPPHLFPLPGFSGGNSIAADANGNAIAVPDDFDTREVKASTYSSGVWSAPVVIGTDTPSSIDIAMDDGGTALVVWYGKFTGNIKTAYFDGLAWSTPSPDPLEVAVSLDIVRVAVSMNGPGNGVAMWTIYSTNTVRSSFFSGGSWSLPTTIGTGNFNPSIAYSANGTVVAGWTDLAGGASVANYTGGIWQSPIVLDATGQNIKVGIDSTGKALAVWNNAAGNVVTSTFDGIALTWSTPQIIAATTGNFFASFGMSPNGTAVVAYQDSSNAGFSISYNGTTWAAPIQFTAGPIDAFAASPSISVSGNGDALVLWLTTTELRSSQLPLGGVWLPEEFVFTVPGNTVRNLDSALSEDGTAFSSWTIAGEAEPQFASVELPPGVLPPTNLQGFTCTNKFASQSDRVNTLTWTPSTDPTVVGYNLRRNGVLIATIPATSLPFYQDHNRCKNVVDVYTLTAVNATGRESIPVSISIL